MKQLFWINPRLGQSTSVRSHFWLVAGVELLVCSYRVVGSLLRNNSCLSRKIRWFQNVSVDSTCLKKASVYVDFSRMWRKELFIPDQHNSEHYINFAVDKRIFHNYPYFAYYYCFLYFVSFNILVSFIKLHFYYLCFFFFLRHLSFSITRRLVCII